MKYLSSVTVLLLAAAVFADEPQKADDQNRPERAAYPLAYGSPAYVGAPIAYHTAPVAYPYAAAPAAYQYAAPAAAYPYAAPAAAVSTAYLAKPAGVAAPAAYQYAAYPYAAPNAYAAPIAYAAHQPAYVKTVHV